MKLELVSFKLCPFVQRSVITLNHKKVDYEITYIDLQSPPDWFQEISPLGKVPLLKVDDEVLFESAVINEFVDEISAGSLLDQAPITRAKQRAWIEYGSELNMLFYQLTGSETQEGFAELCEQIQEKTMRLEQMIDDSGYFNGQDLSLVDTSYAPFLMRVGLLAELTGEEVLPQAQFPNVYSWRKNLLGLEVVQTSVVAAFPQLFTEMVKHRSTYLAGKV